MPDEIPDPDAPRDIFELYPRSLGFLGLIPSWLLVYFMILTPWELAKTHSTTVVYSFTGIAVAVAVGLWSLVLLIAGVHGSRLVADLAPARFGWKQTVLIFGWATLSFFVTVLLQQHFKTHGYPS